MIHFDGDFIISKCKELEPTDISYWVKDFYNKIKKEEMYLNEITIDAVLPVLQYCDNKYETFRVIYTLGRSK